MKTLERAKLTENDIHSIQEAARAMKSDLPVTRVILFGSKARGTASAGSDIDLLVLTSDPVTPALRREIHSRLFDISLNNDAPLSSVVVSERDWSEGLVCHMLIHSEVEREGCTV